MTEDGTELIAYCGLYCGDCAGHQETIADLARDLRKELRRHRFEKTAASLAEVPFFKGMKYYDECYLALGDMVTLRCKKACRGGGGPPFCEIRKCCQKKGIEGCWECDDHATCSKPDFLKANHGDAIQKNIRRIKRKGTKGFVAGPRDWYSKPK